MQYKHFPNINGDFIASVESGGREPILVPYVPTDSDGYAIGNSGVTIGHGVDLGNFNISGLIDDMGVDLFKSIEWLLEFKNLQGDEAIIALEKHLQTKNAPLSISLHAANTLTRLSHEAIFTTLNDNIIKVYDNPANTDSMRTLSLKTLKSPIATAIGSVAIQYGPALHYRTPNFWACICDMNWEAMRDELLNFGDHIRYQTRRHKEAALITNYLKPTQ